MPETPQAQQQFKLDHRGLDWSTVTRTRYICHQRFSYRYPGPIRDLYQRLIVIPPDGYGDQRLVEQSLHVTPDAERAALSTDPFGNSLWELALPWVEREIHFEARMIVERGLPSPALRLPAAEAARFAAPTLLTTADARLARIARELASGAEGEALAERLCDWVAGVMSYGAGSTTVESSAVQALEAGRGLCQDYAHILLALCRELGLPARYVSGHMLAEGGSHAWVEVLLPDGPGHLRTLALDPTNRRRPDLSYVLVAVGRDYRDVAPTTGSYSAPYGGELTFTKSAWLTRVEFRDGTVRHGAAPPLV